MSGDVANMELRFEPPGTGSTSSIPFTSRDR